MTDESLRTLSVQVVGAGRMGRAIAFGLRNAGLAVPEPGGRGERAEGADVVILAVPDAAIAEAARAIEPGRLVAHLSGATALDPLLPHECFSLHPLTTISGKEGGQQAANPFAGVFAALSASSERGLVVAEQLAHRLGMTPFALKEEDRAAYHAAASIASNFLVTLEWFAEDLALSAGVSREVLQPLVAATVRNWAALGPENALTGPIARGDAETVERQRAAVAERLPQRLALFDALTAATRDLARLREMPVSEASAGDHA